MQLTEGDFHNSQWCLAFPSEPELLCSAVPGANLTFCLSHLQSSVSPNVINSSESYSTPNHIKLLYRDSEMKGSHLLLSRVLIFQTAIELEKVCY